MRAASHDRPCAPDRDDVAEHPCRIKLVLLNILDPKQVCQTL
jgi:hypothetical protein